MKSLAKKIIAAILGWQVRRLRRKNNFKIIAVAGSVGKTSSKLAIASVMKAKHRTQYQDGNYNDLVSVPLIFFGGKLPSLFNPLAWIGVFLRNENQLRRPYPYDVVVIEVGTDAPGQIEQFKSYLNIDIAVLTSITPEHMEYFDDLGAVAKEELAIAKMSARMLYNQDLVDAKYSEDLSTQLTSYSIKSQANYQTTKITFKDDKCDFEVLKDGKPFLNTSNDLISEPQLYSATAAVAVASELGLSATEIDKGLHNIHPVSGRMQRLQGIKNSLIIDDTYNASPEAVKAALATLYRLKAPQKIAVLGNMNELGKYSQSAHEEIGILCDPERVDLIVTIGPDANRYLAPAAIGKGCKVESFDDPYSAGEFISGQIKDGSLILVKGSQNRVFAEETVKILLANPEDAQKLVRQSSEWLDIKQRSFKRQE